MIPTSSEVSGRGRLPIHRKPISRGLKRVIDVVLCGVLGIVLAPLLVVIAVCVALDMRASPFFVQDRVGIVARPFRMVKFRSMRSSARPGAPRWDAAEHARVTRLGSLLRDYGLDELPQLWNIFRGDMSIIGPRPPVFDELPSYPADARVAFEMRPGVLSLAAAKGRRGIPLEERFALHGQYVREWSLLLDLQIFIEVAGTVLRRDNATESVGG